MLSYKDTVESKGSKSAGLSGHHQSTGSSRQSSNNNNNHHHGHHPSRESVLGRQLFVGNLPYAVGWQDIKDLMRQAGNVVRVNVMANKDGTSKGHAIVLYATAKEAQKAIEYFSNYKWQGRLLEVKEDMSLYSISHRSQLSGSLNDPDLSTVSENSLANLSFDHGHVPSSYTGEDEHFGIRQVFVTNIPFIVGWQDLKDLFREAGNVVRADIRLDQKTGKSRGHGTVLFSNAKDAERSLVMFDGFEWFGRKIDVKLDKGFRDKTTNPSLDNLIVESHDTSSETLHPEDDEVVYSYSNKPKTFHNCFSWNDVSSPLKTQPSSTPSGMHSLRTPPKPISIPINRTRINYPVGSFTQEMSNLSLSAPDHDKIFFQETPTASSSMLFYGAKSSTFIDQPSMLSKNRFHAKISNPFTLPPLSSQQSSSLSRNFSNDTITEESDNGTSGANRYYTQF